LDRNENDKEIKTSVGFYCFVDLKKKAYFRTEKVERRHENEKKPNESSLN
jgi:hypothetical protein